MEMESSISMGHSFRTTVVALFLLAAQYRAASSTQEEASWSQAIESLPIGADVRVVVRAGASIHGLFRTADDQSLTLKTGGMDRRLAREEIRRLFVADGTRQRLHRDAGLLAGIVGASVFMYLHCRGKAETCYEESMAYYAAFGMAGAGIGHVLPRGTAWRKVYDRD